MKTLIIYGLGKRFNSISFKYAVLPYLAHNYTIVGVSDRKHSMDIDTYGLRFIERDRKQLSQVDNIIVTSDKYFMEIKEELTKKCKIKNEQIISLDEVEDIMIEKLVDTGLFKGQCGIEIGGPSNIFRPIYRTVASCDGVNFSIDTVWWEDNGKGYFYRENNLGNVIIADSTDLGVIKTGTYDFVISSNNIEHIANPIKALKEFVRITKDNGLMLVVVPKKENCFDHRREITSYLHLVNDYNNNISEADLTHLPEIIKLHDYNMDEGIASKEAFIHRAEDNINNRCLHHHVFDIGLLEEIFCNLGIEKISDGVLLGDYYILGRIHKR